ncbi:MAG: tetratricopeptide repeat protein [Gemmatimonadales bacterium]|nr:tetratricopeptide repeat protein [Gemmatimonadales bacterium]
MSIIRRILGGKDDGDTPTPQRLDYLNEALALERQGSYDDALTSYRLAQRDHPGDPRILLNMAIVLTKTGQAEEAIRAYRKVLEIDRHQSGANYGLGFLLLRRGDRAGAARHLQAFLQRPPQGTDAERWVRHAQDALDGLADELEPEPR